jgi:hypothetical protein
MDRLLEKAVAEASMLPEAEQETVGAWLLAEVESMRRWDDLFVRSHEDELGLTMPLDPDEM